MLSIPAEVLPRFCATPRSVAALALTSAELAARLRQYRPIFRIINKCCMMAVSKSTYYECELHTVDGTVVVGNLPQNLSSERDCVITCQIRHVENIIDTEVDWVMRSSIGTLSGCPRPEDVFNIRCQKFAVYQLHQVIIKPRLWYIRPEEEDPLFIAISQTWRYSASSDSRADHICPSGTFVYKRIRDCFFYRSDYQLHKK